MVFYTSARGFSVEENPRLFITGNDGLKACGEKTAQISLTLTPMR